MTPPTVRLAYSLRGGHDRGYPLKTEPGEADGPTIRLATKPTAQGDSNNLRVASPTVRLVPAFNSGSNKSPHPSYDVLTKLDKAASTVRLVSQEGKGGDRGAMLGPGGSPPDSLPALLVSYFYVKGFLDRQAEYRYRDWALDSGAFSADNAGAKIDLNRYIDDSARLMRDDPTLTDVFALDVIGDPEATIRNTEAMVAAGVQAIPAFHFGSPWHYLEDMAKRFPKIALGGAVGLKGNTKMDWAAQCFARVWPKRVHGFGFGSERAAMDLPFHSVDATNWQLGATKFGTWQSFGGAQLSIKGSKQNLRSEIEHYLAIERRARRRWAPTWAAVAGKLR